MLGLGWTEMLVIGIAALIFIGPKELPEVMNRIGKIVGQVRRMGNEFQREINKTTGLDEVRNLRNSITAPLKKTSDEIRREFNAMTPSGPKPSGLMKPADPKAESVVDEIKAAAGMTAPKSADQVAAEAGFKPAGPAPTSPKVGAAPSKKPAAKKAVTGAKKAPVKAAAAPTRPVVATELAPLEAAKPAKKAAIAKKPASRSVAKKSTEPVAPEPVTPKPARKKRVAGAKPAADAAKAGDA